MTILRCAEYLRVSTRTQLDKGMETQRQKNRAMIERLKAGGDDAQFVASFEEGASAFSRTAGERGAVRELLTAVANGQIDAIMFYEESRLSRGIVDLYQDVVIPVRKINKNIRFFKSLTGEEWDPDSQEAKQNLINAYNESQKKSEIALDVQENLLLRSKRPGARIPFGILSITSEHIVPDVSFPIVLFIFELASWGHSERDIAGILTRMKLMGDEERPTAHTTIHHILHNQIYIGNGTWNRRLSKRNSAPSPKKARVYAQYNVLVPQKLWDLAHAALEMKQNRSVGSGETGFLLRGLAHCADCRELMDAKNRVKNVGGVTKTFTKSGEPLRYYFCPKCGTRYDADSLENLIADQFSKDFASHINPSRLEAAINKLMNQVAAFSANLNDRLKDIQYKSALLNASPGASASDDIHVVKQALKHAENDIVELKSELLKLKTELQRLLRPDVIQELSHRVLSPLDQLSRTERRQLLFMAIRSISVRTTPAHTAKADLEYRNVPLPNVAFTFEDLKKRVEEVTVGS